MAATETADKVVVLGIDESEHSERAFHCEYMLFQSLRARLHYLRHLFVMVYSEY